MAGNFVLDCCVVVGFIALQVGESARAMGYDVGVPFLADIDGFRAEIVSPFGLALDDEVSSGCIRSANSPARVHGKGCRDLVEVDADFRGDVGPDRVRFEPPRRCFGVKSHKDLEVFFRWGGDWSSLETYFGCLLWCRWRGLYRRGGGVARRGLERAATGGDAAVRRRRHGRQYRERLAPEVEEAGGELRREAMRNSRHELLCGLIE